MQYILAINAGSTSIKYRLFTHGMDQILSGHLENSKGKFESVLIKKADRYTWEIKESEFKNPTKLILNEIKEYPISAIGFRIVHGGERYTTTTKLTHSIVDKIDEISPLAPLHNPPAIKVIRQFQEVHPNMPMYGIFDTSFHSTLRPEQYLYSLPYEIYTKQKIRKYGFHGISHEYIYNEIRNLEKRHQKMISCHLGGGASITAILNGKSFDTSMGFTPLEGLTMATRAGDVDLGVIFYLIENQNLTLKNAKKMLNEASGLLGISGVTSDMRTLLEMEKHGDERAKLAIEIYIYDIVRYIGSYIAALGGIDILAFSGGVGSGSDVIRARICEKLSQFKIKVAKSKNTNQINVKENLKINNRGSIPIWVIPTNEEKMIAMKTLKALD